MGESVHGRDAFSHLELLNVDISPDFVDGAHFPLFQTVKCLKRLELTWSWSDSVMWQDMESPIESMNPAMFETLTHLTFNGHLFVEVDNFLPNDEDGVLSAPYMGICNSPLSSFRNLQVLCLNLVIQGDLSLVNEDSCDNQWAELCDTVTAPGIFPKLSQVHLLIHIRAQDDMGAVSGANNARYAEELRQSLLTVVYPEQFKALNDRHISGSLDFSFIVEVTTGPVIGT
ncbi:hypothetical protein NMY22_g18883 [Coprinellus aureogranulatus]|nr:hypothetical protein NMY22_g18883 [Coprinellus aureogranulatus]